jgi:hypothetical protein
MRVIRGGCDLCVTAGFLVPIALILPPAHIKGRKKLEDTSDASEEEEAF